MKTLCENCEAKPATSRFRSIRVCFDCSETLGIEEKQFKGQANDFEPSSLGRTDFSFDLGNEMREDYDY